METSFSRFSENGFAIIPEVFSEAEIASIIAMINKADPQNHTFRKTNDLFAIRQFLKEVPEVRSVLFNDALKQVMQQVQKNSFIVKSIYFDKPETSNWFVPWHQDLMISVKEKVAVSGFGPWTIKYGQYSVLPPVKYLQNIFTVRIHLDDTNKHNGALKVIPGSHLKGIQRPESIDWKKEEETSCEVQRGAIMLMKPLLFHSSDRTVNHNQRRVIHIECSDLMLPEQLQWAEQCTVFAAQGT